MECTYISLALMGLFVGVSHAASWNYIQGDANGPGNWGNIAGSACGGNRQSPVDIVVSNVVHDASIPDIVYTGYGTAHSNTYFNIFNNGHSVGVSLETAANQVPPVITISGGGLPGTYKLHSFHFHWGANDSQGAEHPTDSIPYAAELHLVHYKEDYDNLTEAKGHSDGLAVLGIHMRVGDDEHNGFEGFTDHLQNVTYEGNTTQIPEFAMDRLLPGDKQSFFRYEGSLTTPGCNEAVIWTVFRESIMISHDQMAEFRKCRDDHDDPMDNNFRPPVPLNGRTIYSSFVTGGQSRAGATAFVLVIAAVLAVLL